MTTLDNHVSDPSSSRPAAGAVGVRSLADQVFEVVREWIASGRAQPGSKLRISDVAEAVGTSVMPVREAFRRLEQAGLLTVEPYRGARVRSLSIEELEYIYDVRIMLEPEAACLGAVRASGGVVERMRYHWGLLQEASLRADVLTAVLEDELLLGVLYDAGGNPVLARMIRDLWEPCRAYKSLWVMNAIEQGLDTWNHLPRLIDAVQAHDNDVAREALDTVYRQARATVRELLERSLRSPR